MAEELHQQRERDTRFLSLRVISKEFPERKQIPKRSLYPLILSRKGQLTEVFSRGYEVAAEAEE